MRPPLEPLRTQRTEIRPLLPNQARAQGRDPDEQDGDVPYVAMGVPTRQSPNSSRRCASESHQCVSTTRCATAILTQKTSCAGASSETDDKEKGTHLMAYGEMDAARGQADVSLKEEAALSREASERLSGDGANGRNTQDRPSVDDEMRYQAEHPEEQEDEEESDEQSQDEETEEETQDQLAAQEAQDGPDAGLEEQPADQENTAPVGDFEAGSEEVSQEDGWSEEQEEETQEDKEVEDTDIEEDNELGDAQEDEESWDSETSDEESQDEEEEQAYQPSMGW